MCLPDHCTSFRCIGQRDASHVHERRPGPEPELDDAGRGGAGRGRKRPRPATQEIAEVFVSASRSFVGSVLG